MTRSFVSMWKRCKERVRAPEIERERAIYEDEKNFEQSIQVIVVHQLSSSVRDQNLVIFLPLT